MQATIVILLVTLCAFIEASSPTAAPDAEKCNVIPESVTLPKLWKWENRTASTLPYQCNFVYGGGLKRMLYVGRVKTSHGIIPAAIHHYGKAGSETVHFIENGAVTVLDSSEPVEWLCGNGRLAWASVTDLSAKTLRKYKTVPLGFNLKTLSIQYGCIVHSFFSDTYPASVGVVTDGGCQFEVNGSVVNSNDFTFWHTTELLVLA